MTKNKIFSYLLAGFMTFIFLVYNLMSIHLVGPYAWDDGAITLAYSKTLAETGKFSLTAASEIVEGTSSLLLTFVMAALHTIINFDFNNFILASQLIAYFFLITTLLLMYPTIKSVVGHSSSAVSILALFALLPMFSAEIMNGMEMILFCFLITLYYLKFYKNLGWLIVLTPLILLVRFESIFYLGLTIFLVFIIEDKKGRTLAIGLYTVTIFSLLTLFRMLYFDDVFPNTLWAKMHSPYSPEDNFPRIRQKLFGGFEFIKVTFWLLFPLIIIYLIKLNNSLQRYVGHFLVLSFAIFSVIAGKNLGYDGRMFLACIPIMLLLMVLYLKEISDMKIKIVLLPSNSRIEINYKFISFCFLLFFVVSTHVMNFSLHLSNFKTLIAGGYYQNLLPKNFNPIIENQLAERNPYFKISSGVTPENYRTTGYAVDEIRKALNMHKISLMVPDVGGLGLCCSQIEVIDSALLTNKNLAKHGYRVFNEYLSIRSPDIIETHGIWSDFSKIYDSEYFQVNYLPIVFNNNLLWIRRDIYHELSFSSGLDATDLSLPQDLDAVRYAHYKIDLSYLKSRHHSIIRAYKSLQY
jgi:hypothetical protein